MATYRLTIEYRHAKTSYGDIDWDSAVRWRWFIREQVAPSWKGGVHEEKAVIYGRSRWRWRALYKAKRALKKISSGIDVITDYDDINTRIDNLEKELQKMGSLNI